jgi:hypothetical protein
MLLDTGIYAVAFGFKFEAIFVFIFGFIGKKLKKRGRKKVKNPKMKRG